VRINPDGTVKFDFVGKDFVRWVKVVELSPQVVENLRSFMGGPREQIFKEVRSDLVNAFLAEAMPGLTAKVFRTYHATKIVRDYLNKEEVPPSASDFRKKFAATMANLQAAVACHHKRKLPSGWRESLAKKAERVRALSERLAEVKEKHRALAAKEAGRFREKFVKGGKRLLVLKRRLADLRKKPLTPSRRDRLRKLRKRIAEERERLEGFRREFRERRRLRASARAERVRRLRERLEAARLKLELAKATKSYNLGTSLKSYIDPRLYAAWAEKKSFDWRQIYPKSLQRKFAWVEEARLEK
jgi:DNA topoisomerase-1